jgi:hypothetical protein
MAALGPLLDAALTHAWKQHKRTPAELLAQTPAQLGITLGLRVEGPPVRPDPVADLTAANDRRAERGLPPVWPTWHLRSVKGGGRRVAGKRVVSGG